MSFDPFLIIEIPVLIFAIVLHESSHGWMADKCGDPTARLAGRITLNPIPHLDLFGSILLPLFLIIAKSPIKIGYAKPVPVNYFNLRKPRRDAALVGFAGPASNLLAAFISLVFIKIFFPLNFFQLEGLKVLLLTSFTMNLGLAAFNLIPIPPLDGSRIVSGLLPLKLSYQYNKLEPYGFIIIMILLYTGLLDIFFVPIINLIQYILKSMVF